MASAAVKTAQDNAFSSLWIPAVLTDSNRRKMKDLINSVNVNQLETLIEKCCYYAVFYASMSFDEYKAHRREVAIANLDMYLSEYNRRWCCINPFYFLCRQCLIDQHVIIEQKPEIEVGLYRLDKAKKKEDYFFLIHKSVIQHATTLPSFEDLENERIRCSYEKHPEFALISHKWYQVKKTIKKSELVDWQVQQIKRKMGAENFDALAGDSECEVLVGSPDDEKGTFLKYLAKLSDQIADEFLWIDYCCFPQIDAVDKGEYLNMIPELIMKAKRVELFRLNSKYQTSVWCAAESFLIKDDGFFQPENLTIEHLSDLTTLLPIMAAKAVAEADKYFVAASNLDKAIGFTQGGIYFLRTKLQDEKGNINLGIQRQLESEEKLLADLKDKRSIFDNFIGDTTFRLHNVEFPITYPYLWCFTPAIAYISYFYLKQSLQGRE